MNPKTTEMLVNTDIFVSLPLSAYKQWQVGLSFIAIPQM